jgi:PAS domain S-box-containing protein
MPVSLAVSDSDLNRIRHGADVPPLLATIPPSIRQRRAVGVFVLALLASVLVTWPFAAVKLPATPAFVPIIAAALFISYGVTAILLFGQFSILRHRALLVIACGYLFSGLLAVAHALAFPGAFSPTGLNGAGLQSAVLLYAFWHVALPLSAIGYVLLKDTDRTTSATSTQLAISLSVSAMVVLAGAIFWFLTRYNDLLPVTYVDVHPVGLFRKIIGGVVEAIISGVGLGVMWVRRRTLLDELLVVALFAIFVELVLAAVLPGERYNVAWYAARLYQAVTATVVMIVLLAETIRLYAISLENTRLYRDLADREAKIRRLVDANIIGIFVADRKSQIVEANDAFLRMLGYEREDLAWGRLRWTELSPPEWRDRDLLTKAQLDSTGIVQPFEKEYFRKDGTRVPVLVGATLFTEGGDQGVAFVLDLTERKRAEEEHERLRQLESDLAHVNRLSMMGELAASLAHEVLHPIATARNNARAGTRFLELNPPNLDEVREALNCVVRDVDRARDIVGRMRDHIKKAPRRREPFDLNEAVGEVIVMVRSAIAKNGIAVSTQFADGLVPVQGDRVQLQQVVMNLILNAVEAMSAPDVRPRELSISTEQDRTGALVAVRDSGPGINPEQLERVFQAFYTTKSGGLGMGLSICRSIIDAHGGRLWAEANEPRGAVFQFTLPAGQEES